MSKKDSKSHEAGSAGQLSHSAEYHIIQHDLIRVIMLNIVYLGALLALYYSNQHSQYVETFISRWLHL